jgi:Protein of unknown function (DUF4087)
MMMNFRMCLALLAASALSTAIGAALAAPPKPDAKSALRCGWFDNPTPQNASLIDRDGEWAISVQGGHASSGAWPPKFKASQWVRTNAGSYGYGCACFKVSVDKEATQITHIASAYARPLSACRNDKALKASEPYNPFK